MLRREFLQIGHIDVFLEFVTIASACNKVMRKRFLKPNTIGLINPGAYTGNINYSKKAKMWLLYGEQTDGCTIKHSTNGRVCRLSEHPNRSVDGSCAETRTVYEFLGCFLHGQTCLHFRDVSTLAKDTIDERYEKTMARLQGITISAYTVEVVWECQFDRESYRSITN